MKRLVLTITTLFIMLFPIIAAPSVNDVRIWPLNGSTSINLLSKDYPERDTGDGVYLKWVGGASNQNKGTFLDKNIIGLAQIGFDGMTQNERLYWSIDVVCSNGDYKLVSQSESAYSRPFKVFTVVSWPQYTAKNGDGRLGVYEIVSGSSTTRKAFPYERESNWWGGTTTYDSGYLVFDILIALPENDDDNDGVLTYNGKNYFLADKEDYAAMVTATVSVTKEDGTLVDKAIISFPVTGYVSYNSSATLSDKFSLLVTPNDYSRNIQLENTGVSQQIATIDFLYGIRNGSATPNGSPAIFLSSSSNPYDSSAGKFTFIHEDAGSFITSRNSITYKIVVSDGVTRTEFDGTDYVSSGAENYNNLENKLSIQSNVAYYSARGDTPYSWWDYNGTINLILDSHPDIMNAGRYESSVYVHVLALETSN